MSKMLQKDYPYLFRKEIIDSVETIRKAYDDGCMLLARGEGGGVVQLLDPAATQIIRLRATL